MHRFGHDGRVIDADADVRARPVDGDKDRSPMAQPTDVPGTAALAICESLLLALADRKILPEAEIIGILQDAAATHHHEPGSREATALHAAVEAVINGILRGGNAGGRG